MDSPPQGVIARLAHELGKLPGIGPKSAERLTHHLLAAPRNEVLALATTRLRRELEARLDEDSDFQHMLDEVVGRRLDPASAAKLIIDAATSP